MAKQWFISRGNGSEGPLGSEDLRRLARVGEFSTDDHVWSPGMTEWASAKLLKGLFPSSAEQLSSTVAEQVAKSSSSRLPQPLSPSTVSRFQYMPRFRPGHLAVTKHALKIVGLLIVVAVLASAFRDWTDRIEITGYFCLAESDSGGKTKVILSEGPLIPVGTWYSSPEDLWKGMASSSLQKSIHCYFDKKPVALNMLSYGQLVTIIGNVKIKDGLSVLEHCEFARR